MSISEQVFADSHSHQADWRIMVGGGALGLIAFFLFGIAWIVFTSPADQERIDQLGGETPVAVATPRLDVSTIVTQTSVAANDNSVQNDVAYNDNQSLANLANVKPATDQVTKVQAVTAPPTPVVDKVLPVQNSAVEIKEAEAAQLAKLDIPVFEKPVPAETKDISDIEFDLLPPRAVEKSNVPRRRSEHELTEDLKKVVKEIDLRSMKTTIYNLNMAVEDEKKVGKARRSDAFRSADLNEFHPILHLADTDDNLYGLPFRRGNACRIERDVIPMMNQVSRELTGIRANFARLGAAASRGATGVTATQEDAQYEIAKHVAKQDSWHNNEAVPALLQTLQADGRVVRLELINALAETPSAESSRALAKRAMFDLWSGARYAATDALQDRPRRDYRSELLNGLRYPWAPIAEHAAETLVTLKDQSAIRPLIELLDAPDPNQPYRDPHGVLVQNELVRVNHMRNCTLCHAPSLASSDNIRGLIPTPGQAVPVVYYQSQSGEFVRADVTYIKQDFSTTDEVKNAAPWPEQQRFDYFVRQRKLNDDEVTLYKMDEARATKSNETYPQRKSVLYALRELTGVDAGDSAAAWQRYYVEHYALR